MRTMIAAFAFVLLPIRAFAGEVDVVDARATMSADGNWRFDVTLRHADDGWDHYADAWEVLAPDGKVLAKRVLYHPHVDEQPFTRSLSGVRIPNGISTVTVRGHDKVHGYGGKTLSVTLR
jgi:hypothetical protein